MRVGTFHNQINNPPSRVKSSALLYMEPEIRKPAYPVTLDKKREIIAYYKAQPDNASREQRTMAMFPDEVKKRGLIQRWMKALQDS